MIRLGYWPFALLALVGAATFSASGCSDGATATTGDPTDVVSGSYALVVAPDATPPLTIGVGGTDTTAMKGLLLRAASECRVGLRRDEDIRPFVSANVAAVVPNFSDTTGDPRRLFSATPAAKCDQVLEQTEALVCMADKLAAIGDAVGSLRWETIPDLRAREAAGVASEERYALPWTIPPQAEKDRFIARDLALHVLALAARLEGSPLPVGGGLFTCGEIYAALDAQKPSATMVDANVAITNLADVAFDDAWQGGDRAPGFMPVAADAWSAKSTRPHAVARPRVMHELKVLRAAGALTKRLVEANVAADTAGAAAKLARAADTRIGAEKAWGRGDAYDSLAHAARTLTGRLEVGVKGGGAWFPADMACAGIGALDVAARSYGGGLRGRIEDPTLATPAQVQAATLASMLGVAVPRAALEGLDVAELRVLLGDQLVAAQAARSGATTATQIDAIRNGALGATWRAQLAELAGPDLLVGIEYAWATARMRIGADGKDFAKATARTGLVRMPSADEKLVAAFGAVPVVDDVLDRRAVPRDQWSRSVSLTAPSMCAEPGGYAQAFAITAPASTSVDLFNWQANDLDRVPRWVGQDAFSLAQYLERRATVLGARAAVATAGEADARAEAARVATELRAWAGPARVFVSTLESMQNCSASFASNTPGCVDDVVKTFEVEVQGASAEALGLTAEDVAKGSARALAAVSLVVGYPYEAECVAQEGRGCRALPTGRGALTATSFARVVPSGGEPTLAANIGVYDAFRWRFDDAQAVAAIIAAKNAAASRSPESTVDTRVFVVGADPRGGGRRAILGEVGFPTVPREPASTTGTLMRPRRFVTSFPLATLQQTALMNVMSLPVAATTPQVSGGGAGAPGSSCVENQDSLFVPLDNDMVQGPAGTEDSWRYWLDRATTLAAEADRHASDLLSARLVVENRRETAATRLASICGTTGAVSRLKIKDNTIDASGDPALSACLGTNNVDVFTFGQMPTDDAAKAAVFTRVANDLDCARRQDRICNRLENGTAVHVSAGLSFSRLEAQGKTPACGEAAVSFPVLTVPRPGVVSAPRISSVQRRSLGQILATRASGLDARTWLRDGKAVGYAGLDVLSSLGRARLVQKNDATWTVSVGGSVRLASDVSSDPTKAQPWPGCLRWGNCNPTGDATTGFAVDALNASFRRCANGSAWSVAAPATLSQCEALPPTIRDADWRALANDVLWRVEGGLWLGQMLSGGVRAGAFSIPVPVQREWASVSTFQRPNWMRNYDYELVTTQTDYVSLTGSVFTPHPTEPNTWVIGGGAIGPRAETISDSFFLRPLPTIDGRERWPSRMRKVYPSIAPNDYSSTALQGLKGRMLHVPGISLAYPASLEPADFGSRIRTVDGVIDESNYDLLVNSLAGTRSDHFNLLDQIAQAKLSTAAEIAPTGQNPPPVVWWSSSLERNHDFSGYFRPNLTEARSNFYFFSSMGLPTSNEDRRLYAYHRPALFGPNVAPSVCFADICSTYTDGVWGDRRGCSQGQPQDALRSMSANARARAFVNSTPAYSGEERFREFAGAHALACALSSSAMYDDGAMPQPTPPAANVEQALNAMSGFAAKLARRVDESLGDLYLVNVPTLVATRQDSNPTSGSGMLMEAATSVRAKLIGVREAAAEMNDTTWELANAIELARVDFQLQSNRGEQRYKELHLRKLRVVEDNILAPLEALRDLAKVAGETKWYNPSTWVANPVQMGAIAAITAVRLTYNVLELEALDDLSSLTEDEQKLEATKALKNLYTTAKVASNKLRGQLAALRQRQLEASQELARFQALQAEAREAAAIASGAQQLADENGTVRPIPINIVNDRLEEGNFRRYKEALVRAKQAAFYARRAFEQKIGMPLTAITGKISGYDPPGVWIDSVCRTTGVDYKKFRTLEAGDGGVVQNTANAAQVGAYVDSWIGDYVAKFRSYAEAFLVQYPFTSGDDVALLSMRSQLLATSSGCSEPTRNRVTFSGTLDRIGSPIANEPFRPVIGWQVHPCGAAAAGCLQARNGALVNLPLAPDAGAAAGVSRDDVTWLQEASATPPVVSLDAGVADAGLRDGGLDAGVADAAVADAGARAPGAGASTGVGADWPSGWISQAVSVEAGTYRVSFKDLALDANGNATAAGVPFAVAVFGLDSWGSALLSPQPITPTSAWSDRSVTFTTASSGNVRVAFRASLETDGRLGSVALANLQVEKLEANESLASPVVYQRTHGALTVPINTCNPQSGERFRNLFVHDCEADGRCYWELATPFRIPVTLLSRADLPEGSAGRTRYNHRLGQLALNVVGSGVRDCEGTADYASCASAQSVEYTLEHDGAGARLYGLESSAFAAGPYPFSFGKASLTGRAIAAERNFSYLSTADRSIAFSGGVGKGDFDGRPIDGGTFYRLRIWDTPELRWDRVDDIQVLLTYRYWSKLRGNSW